MNIAAWLAAISWPLVTRLFASLGLGFVTFTGADLALTTALDLVRTSFGGMSADVAQLVARAGFFQAVSIIFGGLVSGLAWMSFKKLAFFTG